MRILFVRRYGIGILWRGRRHEFHRDGDGRLGLPWSHTRPRSNQGASHA